MNIELLLSFIREMYNRGYTDGYTDANVQLEAQKAKEGKDNG